MGLYFLMVIYLSLWYTYWSESLLTSNTKELNILFVEFNLLSTEQQNYLKGNIMPVRFSMTCTFWAPPVSVKSKTQHKGQRKVIC